MKLIIFLLALIRSAFQANSHASFSQERRALEDYLSQASSIAELEYRERQWLGSRASGNAFCQASNPL